MIVFGGQGQKELFDDLWRFDFDTYEWYTVRTHNTGPHDKPRHVTHRYLRSVPLLDNSLPKPEARKEHAACVVHGMMFMWGGRDMFGVDAIEDTIW